MSLNVKNIASINASKKDEKNEGSAVLDFLNKDIALFDKGLDDKKKEAFYSELSILLSSGIDIKTAQELIIEEQTKEKEKAMFTSIYTRVVAGESLSESLRKTGKISDYEFYSIKIGEESGRLAFTLGELSKYYKKKIKLKRQLVGALTYPMMVLSIAIVAVVFMLNFMVPMFVDIFKRFNAKLPALTQLIVDISSMLGSNMLYIVLVVVTIVVFVVYSREKLWFRVYSAKILLRLPLFGNVIRTIYLERFFQSMALLMASRTPMLRSLQLVKNMIGFYELERILGQVEDDIMHGKLLNQSMARHTFFDRRIISLIKVAEEVNQLDTMFEKLDQQYAEELEHKLGVMSTLLEPIMIIFVGILVAVILIAMYLPMFQLGTTVY